MSAVQPQVAPATGALWRALDHPHAATTVALADPEKGSLAAVTWASMHLAAVASVLHPVARRLLPHGRARLGVVVEADRALQSALWRLDRRLTGDVHVSGHNVLALQRHVTATLEQHASRERDLVEELVGRLSEPEQDALAQRVTDAARKAPTRPHPHAPVTGAVSVLAFRVDAAADHLRDVMDSRSNPAPRDVPAPRVSGRWGAYVMGAPYPAPRQSRTVRATRRS